jgi:serine/threonine protein kinase/tetratricopeptide (TPR) repeat protein
VDDSGASAILRPISSRLRYNPGQIHASRAKNGLGSRKPTKARDREGKEGSIMRDESRREPQPEDPDTTEFETPVARQPERIGNYRIIKRIGAGGMGVVYEAEQSHPRRLVALKVIRGGTYVDETHLRMFHREAQTLGRLKHPAIAAIFESGDTEDGQHFFAMELVRGETLSQWLLKHNPRSLSTAELRLRLELFRKICEAVAYAHQRGVVHRDLKPSNILVTKESRGVSGAAGGEVPDVKILDFGLARITDSDVELSTIVTQVGKVQGTLPYMSPEQFKGVPEEIDLRTDVYSLGVVLYEMLTGQLPHDVSRATIHEAARIVCDEQVKPLSGSWSGARGPDRDIETIVLKAIEKEPSRRYQGVSSISEDIQRYLCDQPITARPPSAVYQIRKMVARHRLGFGFAGSLLVMLVALAVSMTVQASLIASERDRANHEAMTAERVSAFLIDLFKVADPHESKGNTVTARELLDQGAGRLRQELRGEPLVQARMMVTVGNVYQRLGLYEKARPLLEESLLIRRELLAADDPVIAESLTALAGFHRFVGEYSEARRFYEEALELLQAAWGAAHPDVAKAVSNLSVVHWQTGRYDESLELQMRALEIREATLGPDDILVAHSLNNLSLLLKERGEYDEALLMAKRALEIKETRLGPDHPDTAMTRGNLATLLRRMGDYAAARPLLEQSLTTREETLGPEHPDVAQSLNNLANLLQTTGDYVEARPLYERSLAIREKALGPDHIDVSQTLNNLAVLLVATGEFDTARLHYERALTIREEVLGPEHRRVAQTSNNLANLYRRDGENLDESLALYERGLAIYEKALGPEHLEVGLILQPIAIVHFLQGRPEESREHHERAVRVFEETVGLDHPEVLYSLAAYHAATGARDSSIDYLQRAVDAGYSTLWLTRDPDLESLHGDPEFEEIAARLGNPDPDRRGDH